MKVRQLRILSISDIHLGHPKTSTAYILRNLEQALPSQSWMNEVDLILFGGDLFDRLLTFNSPDAFLIKRWMRQFCEMCARKDIVIRVLEGTPSHDHRQNKWFDEQKNETTVDLRYIDTLMIEHIERFGIDILYIPDEWKGNDTDAVWMDVRKAMSDRGLEKVDFSLIHATMDYQLAAEFRVPMHNTQRYLDITRYYVFSGHIHQSSVYEQRHLCNGSFDRLCHGDEGKKGFWDVTVCPETGNHVVFRENQNAKIYRTIDLRDHREDYMRQLTAVEQYPEDSHLRLFVGKDDPILAAFDSIKKLYPQFHWTVKIDRSEDTQKALFQDKRGQFQQTNFTKDNLTHILLERIRKRYQDPELISACERALQEYVI